MISSNGRHGYGRAALTLVAGLSALIVACGAAATPTARPAPPTATARTVATATRPAPTASAYTPTAAPSAVTQPPATPTTAVQPTATAAASPPAANLPATPGGVSFSADIGPLFQKNCIRCHGGPEPTMGMSLESYQGAIKGSKNGPVIVPGNPEKSLMYLYTRDGIMPYGGPRLPASEVEKIRAWIAAGAPNN